MKIKLSEIDAAIVEEVFVWYDDRGMYGGENGYRELEGDRFTVLVRNYSPSTDANHALEALERWCGEYDGESVIEYGLYGGNPKWSVLLVPTNTPVVIADTLSESLTIAICLALLSAVRGETVKLDNAEGE